MYFPLLLLKYSISRAVVPHHVPTSHYASVVFDEKFCIPVYILNFPISLSPHTQALPRGEPSLWITTHPHLFHHLWVWLLIAHFSSQVVLLLLFPFSLLPGGFEFPLPAIFTQFLACSGAGTQCCYQLPTSWGMWSARG